MRKDFIKVLTERPRSGGRDTYGSLAKRTRNNMDGGTEGMRAPYKRTGDWKEFTDLIGPLYKFLQSRVGHPWDQVHSEICEQLKGRSTQQQHLMDHVEKAVDKNLFYEDGKLYESDGKHYSLDGRYRYTFYVDPRDGILKVPAQRGGKGYFNAAGKWTYGLAKPPLEEFKTNDGSSFKKFHGIWYQVTVHTASFSVANADGTLSWYTSHVEQKRQLNRKELKKFQIVNTPS